MPVPLGTESMLKKIAALTLCTVVCLGGCAVNVKTEKKPQASITLDIINRSSQDKLTAVYFEDSYDCFGIKSIVVNSSQRNITVSLEKKPYQTIYIKYVGSTFDGANFHPRSCSTSYTFRADESDAYTVILENVYNNCDVEVRRDVLTASAFLIQKVKLNSRQPAAAVPAVSSGPWCEAVEAFKG